MPTYGLLVDAGVLGAGDLDPRKNFICCCEYVRCSGRESARSLLSGEVLFSGGVTDCCVEVVYCSDWDDGRTGLEKFGVVRLTTAIRPARSPASTPGDETLTVGTAVARSVPVGDVE